METTKPVLDFYSKNPNFNEIDGSLEIDEITAKIDTFLKYAQILEDQKNNLAYREETEVPLCIVAAGGVTFFAIQDLKRIN